MSMIAAGYVKPVPMTGETNTSSAPQAAVSVVLVGGETLYREGVRSMLDRNGVLVLGEFAEVGAPDCAQKGKLAPDVVLALNPDFSVADGQDWRLRLQHVWPGSKVVAMAQPGEEGVLAAAVKAGADGCLFTDTSAEALVQSVKLVALGEGLFPARIAALIAGSGQPCARPRLTPREKDILRGLLAGYSNKMIANDLGTTDMTVKAQLRHLLRKLGVANRTQAALWAREQGMMTEAHH